MNPTIEDLKTCGGICPICHDNLKDATMLHCKHIFCEECVATWFDRERTCPMCRAQVSKSLSIFLLIGSLGGPVINVSCGPIS